MLASIGSYLLIIAMVLYSINLGYFFYATILTY